MSFIINETIGCEIRWKVYAWDENGNWNESKEFSFLTSGKPNCKIKGYVHYRDSGKLVPEGTVEYVVGNGKINGIQDFRNGFFELNCYVPPSFLEKTFSIGLIFSSGKFKSFNQLILGLGELHQYAKCVNKKWHFWGHAIDLEGKKIERGSMRVKIVETNDFNLTHFSNGKWEILLSSCVIPGKIYTFQFTIESSGKKANLFSRYMAEV